MRLFLTMVTVGCLLGGLTDTATAEGLILDFNTVGTSNETGYQAYTVNAWKNPSLFDTKSYAATFARTGSATVSVTPAWSTPGSGGTMCDRASSWDGLWQGNNINLLTDWIGTCVRSDYYGNDYWYRDDPETTSVPTYMTLSLGGLPAGTYYWLSYHHDTEKIWSDFQVEVSTDGGASYGAATDVKITSCASTQGLPPAPTDYIGIPGYDPQDLPSTFTTSFVADGANAVVLRFAPFIPDGGPVGSHTSWFIMNGFKLSSQDYYTNPRPGDANRDGFVDENDAATLAANWQVSTGAGWSMGDFNGDGAVNDIDVTLLATNWGSGSGAAVPEPSNCVLLCGAAILLLVMKQRRIRS